MFPSQGIEQNSQLSHHSEFSLSMLPIYEYPPFLLSLSALWVDNYRLYYFISLLLSFFKKDNLKKKLYGDHGSYFPSLFGKEWIKQILIHNILCSAYIHQTITKINSIQTSKASLCIKAIMWWNTNMIFYVCCIYFKSYMWIMMTHKTDLYGD